MELTWVPEGNAFWDEDKQRIIGGAPAGALDIQGAPGERLSGDWWAATDDDQLVAGYGWLDATWAAMPKSSSRWTPTAKPPGSEVSSSNTSRRKQPNEA